MDDFVWVRTRCSFAGHLVEFDKEGRVLVGPPDLVGRTVKLHGAGLFVMEGDVEVSIGLVTRRTLVGPQRVTRVAPPPR